MPPPPCRRSPNLAARRDVIIEAPSFTGGADIAALVPIPFATLVDRMRREADATRSIFDLPARKWFLPDPALDFSARHFDRRAATPVGPAAGPHTQLAQNIVLAWLAGSRIIELKTVQHDDRLHIPRPCIHVPNVGYNVEWSQELLVAQSAMEYAKAVYLIEILKSTRAFGLIPDTPGIDRHFDTVFDISVGYDLEGIKSPKVTVFLQAMQHAVSLFEELRPELYGDLAEFREMELPSTISDCVTLSTFHGCPAEQIEDIGYYLIRDLGLHTIIKLNPTLLGFERVEELLHDRLGYTHVKLRREAFEDDLQYDQALDVLRNLRAIAESRRSSIGAKFTNTLVVANDQEIFPTQTDPNMYLSGPPLHVISMNLMQQFREDLGFEFPVSFSAGIDAKNFPRTIACGLVPVTTCTDLLRQGGYGRLPAYLRGLAREMTQIDVTSREAYVLTVRRCGPEAVAESLKVLTGSDDIWQREAIGITEIANDRPDDLPAAIRTLAGAEGLDPEAVMLHATRVAGRLNGRDFIPQLVETPRYLARANAQPPRRIDRTLDLYDCINCDLCISACPNDAIFAYDAEVVLTATEVLAAKNGEVVHEPGRGYGLSETHQLAVVEGACNECSNCEVYCPELGAPFVVKERIFLTPDDFERCPELDGFCRFGDGLLARIDGLPFRLEFDTVPNLATVRGDGVELRMKWDSLEVTRATFDNPTLRIDIATLWRMRTVWTSIFHSHRPNMVSADPQASAPPSP